MAGFKINEVNKNDAIPEDGAPLLIKPVKTGMAEQEQNGVTEPKIAPKNCLEWGVLL